MTRESKKLYYSDVWRLKHVRLSISIWEPTSLHQGWAVILGLAGCITNLDKLQHTTLRYGKIVPVHHAMTTYCRSRGTAPRIPNLSTWW
jgi:hypothetical protein